MTKKIVKNTPTNPPVKEASSGPVPTVPTAPEKKLPEEAKADESAEASQGGASSQDETKAGETAGASLDNSASEVEAKTGEETPDDSAAQGEKAEEEVDPVITRAKEVFQSHDIDEIYFTIDGSAFTQHQHALMHADNFQDKTIRPVKRSEV